MSELVNFAVYYGPGTVRTNEMGVDLSEFARLELQLPSPEKVSITDLKYWLTANFSLNTDTTTVSIQSVWSKSPSNIFWVLRPIERNSQWVSWLEACKRRRSHPVALVLPAAKENESRQGSQATDEMHVSGSGYVSHSGGNHSGHGSQSSYDMDASGSAYASHTGGGGYEEGQSSQSTGGTESGEADGDEEDGQMQNLMNEEDMDGLEEDLDSDDSNEDDDDDDDDDSEVPIPSSWNQDFSNFMMVDDGHESAWAYHQGKVEIGSMYASKESLREAVVQWAMSTQRDFRTDVSSKKYLTMSCSEEGCPARVHAVVPKWDHTWEVTDVVPHTCVISHLLTDHRNLTSTIIAKLMFSEIVKNKDMVVGAIQTAVKTRFDYSISYGKAWRAKQRALEERFGSFFDAYDGVVRLLRTLQERNPGTHVDIQHWVHPEIPGVKVLHRVFFSFAICIEAFRHCRPIMCVDGTFLTGKYRGQILTAIGVDGNNMIVPLAMAFVEGENYESWLWFFRQVKAAIVKDRPNVCVLHDRHAGILKAIKALQEPSNDEPTPWKDLQSRWCMRHLGANFYSQFRNKRLMNMFKKLCMQNQQVKYDFLWKILNDFTKKQVKERRAAENAAVAALLAGAVPPTVPEPVGLCDLPAIDPPGTKRKNGRRIRSFEQWIEKEPPVKWSLLHDLHGARYGIMTTNLAEVYNFVLRGNRALPLTAIVEGVFHGTLKYFRERRERAVKHMMNNPATPYCEKVMQYMEKKINKAKLHTVLAVGNQERRYEVRLPTDKFGTANEIKTQEVKIGSELRPTCECTCNKPKLLHLPCSHVLAACGQLKMDAISFVSEYYLKDSVLNTWTGEMYGFRAMGNFNKVNIEEREYMPDPRLMRTSRGRRRSARIRNDMDESEAGGCTRQCVLCSNFGHRDKHCPVFGRGRGRGGRATRGGRGGRGRGLEEGEAI